MGGVERRQCGYRGTAGDAVREAGDGKGARAAGCLPWCLGGGYVGMEVG